MSQLIGLAQVALLKLWGFGVEYSGLGCIEGLGQLRLWSLSELRVARLVFYSLGL